MEKIYDVIVVGAGAGGMTVALYSARAGKSVLVIERGMYGGAMRDTSEIENYLGVGKVTGDELSEAMYRQMMEFSDKITYQYGNVNKIEKQRELGAPSVFKVSTRKGEYTGRSVVVATGVKHKDLGVVGESDYKGSGVSNCATCDGSFFKNKDVAVIGGGDSAFEEGVYLADIANSVTLMYYRNKENVKAQQILQDRFFAKGNTKAIFNADVEEFNGDGKSLKAITFGQPRGRNGFTKGTSIDVDGAFVYVGVEPNTDFNVTLSNPMRQWSLDNEVFSEDGYVYVDNDMESKHVRGLFAVGDVVYGSVRQIASAVGDGAVASRYILEYLNGLE